MPSGTISQPPENPAGTGYPERYEGIAHFLLQKNPPDHIALLKVTKGDLILIPPGYGHVTINPSQDKTLILANLISTAFVSNYAIYDAMHGAAYYELIGNNLLHNPHYPPVPPPRKIKSPMLLLPLFRDVGSLYDTVGNTAIAGMLQPSGKEYGGFSPGFFSRAIFFK